HDSERVAQFQWPVVRREVTQIPTPTGVASLHRPSPCRRAGTCPTHVTVQLQARRKI
uniref:Uncharacterized protein n=1 Tax=Anopheles minimus TaxID=112268 RepID=A0A182WNH7_9DIPT